MRIHHLISTPNGGAGIATRKIVNCVSRNDEHRVFFGSHPESAPNWQYSPVKTRSFTQRAMRLRYSLAKKLRPSSPEQLSLAQAGDATALPPEFACCDIVHLHWLGDHWIPLDSVIKLLKPGTPIIWTLHDQNPITAICHYTGECRGYESGCSPCPWLNPIGQGLVRTSFAAKQQVFSMHPVHLVCISEWQHNLVCTSRLGKMAASSQVIGLPFTASKAPDLHSGRNAARIALGLNPDASYALIGATNLANRRKGFALAMEAARQAGPSLRWLTFGKTNPALHADHHFGTVTDVARLTMIYRSANVFVMPSIEESLGLTGIEAMSNGTPVIGFANTGLADYVIPARTGLLAEQKTAEALAAALKQLSLFPTLTNPAQVIHSFNDVWRARYAPELVATKYQTLYQAVLLNPERTSRA